LEKGDVDGAYAAAYDAYRMAAEALLARQGLRATGGDGSHMAVEDAISAQFVAEIPAFAKPIFERLRRTRHTAQYFDPSAAPISGPDVEWAIEKATAALEGAKAGALRYAAGAVQLVLAECELEHRAAGHVLVEGARPRVQPAGITDGRLNRPAEARFGFTDRFIELVPVGLAEHQDVDVAHWPPPGLPGMTGRP
jgi:hypothetical protein